MEDTLTTAPQARLFVGMGGSGIKTLAKFVDLLTEHSKETANSEVFVAFLLVDTDGGELAEYERQIRRAYERVHREPILRTVHLSADITDFSSFVASKLKKGGHHERLRDVWWYRTNRRDQDEPFTAINLKDSPTRGAGQCPLVSTFLAWNQMRTIDSTIDDLLNTLKNRSVQGKNLQNWTLDVSLVAGLAGGTGRGCWHLVASKIREKLRDLNQRPKPVGFFFDSSVFAEDVKREEQVTKLRVNSITGVSELVAWLRNEYERDTDLSPFQFRLPSLENPAASSSDLIDTTKLNLTVGGEELQGITGRAPISAAYLIFGAGKQGTLGEASAYYQSVASALYARLFSSTATTNINEAGHLNGLGSASISVPIAGIRTYVQEYVRQFLPALYSAPVEEEKIDRVVNTLFAGFESPDTIPRAGDATARNVHQRVYAKILGDTGKMKKRLEEQLRDRKYNEADTTAKSLTNWASSNESEIGSFVRRDVASQMWGSLVSADTLEAGGVLQTLIPDTVSKVTKANESLLARLFEESQTKAPLNPIAEAVRLLLGTGRVDLPSATGREPLDISSYGTKRVIAEKASERLKVILEANAQRRLPGVAQAKGASLVKPSEELSKAKNGLFKTSVSAEERDVITSRVEPWLLSQANDVIDESLTKLLKTAKEEIDSLARSLKAVAGTLAKRASDEKAKTERSREVHFWTEKDFDEILEPQKSSFDRSILSSQTLQGVAQDDELEREFARIMKFQCLPGFEEARQRFIDAIQRWIGAQSAEKLEERKLTDIVHDNLTAMGDQFMLPLNFYEETFGFFETVKRLMRVWGKTMLERAGSPRDLAKLRQVFENQFGIPFPKSADPSGAPKELDDEELKDLTQNACKAMAIRLGGRTDPLFQQRFDEGERPTYDSVTVVLPTQPIFDKKFAKEVDDEAKRNPQFFASGQFKATPTSGMLDAGNPYTMFAYATQQFEDWRRDSGMARIASLEYYKMPSVLSWLRACEDPAGTSVFLDGDVLREKYDIPSCRDIYGLGYISPLFVHDKTLRELRWSPWDESKRRSADMRNERFDLVAYALLESPPTDCAKYFREVLKKAEWPMPLLKPRGAADAAASESKPAWSYTRPAIRLCTEVTAKKERDANHPAFAANHGHVSIRKCIEELLEDDAVAAAIAGEASLFMSEVLCKDEYADDFHPDKDIALAFKYLGDRLRDAKEQQDGPAADRMKKVIDELLRRVAVLETYSPEQLQEHFDSIRRNSELQTRA
jgi:hypothetical protein